jgi:hypothetical protein
VIAAGSGTIAAATSAPEATGSSQPATNSASVATAPAPTRTTWSRSCPEARRRRIPSDATPSSAPSTTTGRVALTTVQAPSTPAGWLSGP